jgi:uncharacterized membrane protein YciS (DUF1049 family)
MKKIFAVLFIVISVFLSIGFIIQIPEIIINISKANSPYGIGYLIGSLLPLVIIIGLFRIGLKWFKSKSKTDNEINDIGLN